MEKVHSDRQSTPSVTINSIRLSSSSRSFFGPTNPGSEKGLFVEAHSIPSICDLHSHLLLNPVSGHTLRPRQFTDATRKTLLSVLISAKPRRNRIGSRARVINQ